MFRSILSARTPASDRDRPSKQALMWVGGIHSAGPGLVSGSPWPVRWWVVEGWWLSPAGSTGGRLLLRSGIDDEVAVAHRFVADSEFEDPVEHESAAA